MAPPAFALIALIFAILLTVTTVASSAIAIQAYNDNPNYYPSGNVQLKNNNTIFLWSNMVLGLIVFFLSIGGIMSSCY